MDIFMFVYILYSCCNTN